MRKVISGIPASSRRRKSRIITARILRSKLFREAKCVLIYYSMASEVGTRTLIRSAIKCGKKVYVPYIIGTKKLSYHLVSCSTQFKKNHWGVYEPVPGKFRNGSRARLDLILVPGLGFDRKKNRLGRGMGYFDRFLKGKKESVFIGLAYREQIVKKIPVRVHDVPMHDVFSA